LPSAQKATQGCHETTTLEVNDSKVSFEKEILLYWQLDIPEAKKADYRPTPNASSQHHVDVTTPMRLA
jgi:hypothetical protein